MLMRFIGKDGSMGLKHGSTYCVKITDSNGFIWVSWGYGKACIYESPQSFAANWGKA